MNKAVPIGIGLAIVGALAFMGGSAKAAPTPVTPPAPPTPMTWKQAFDTGGVRALAGWLSIGIAGSRWTFFQEPDKSQSSVQRDNSEALKFLQSHVGLTADATLGPATSGVLIYFNPEVESVLDEMGAKKAHHFDLTPFTAAQIAVAVKNGKDHAKAAEAAELSSKK